MSDSIEGTRDVRNHEVDLLRTITRCPFVEAQFQEPTLEQPCSGVILTQAPLVRDAHQVPEPWSGHISTAPLLFFGSNPSIYPIEVFPTEAWEDDDVRDFFENRFGGGRREWVHRLRVLRNDGTHGPASRWVPFWAACAGRAGELLNRKAIPGIDFAITEAVHCKSKRESFQGIPVAKTAATTCADLYLRKVVDLSPARVIVSFGGIADVEIRRIFDLAPGRYAVAGMRHFIFLDHPAGRGRLKKISTVVSPAQLESLRQSAFESRIPTSPRLRSPDAAQTTVKGDPMQTDHESGLEPEDDAGASGARLRRKFHRAVEYALRLHQKQTQKSTSILYAGHFLGVCSIVIDAGGDQDEAIAALLQDGPKDQGGKATLNEIRMLFGRRVGELVEHLSDTLKTDNEGEKPAWRPRKEAYLLKLRECHDQSVRLISAADKLHDLRSMLDDYRTHGESLWGRFSAPLGRVDILWYHDALLTIYDSGPQDQRLTPILENMRAIISAIRSHSL